jgi:hypothetical protein
LAAAEPHAPSWAVHSVPHADASADHATLASQAAANDQSPQELAPSARYMAANFAAVRAADPILGRGLLGVAGVDARTVASRGAPVEPLAQMTPPGDVRRARFLLAMAVAPSSELSARTGERIVRNLSDDRMNDDGIRRFNAKADRLSVKF